MSNAYSLYGLRLSSDIRLPELSDAINQGPSDVDISLGSLSRDLSKGGRDNETCDKGYVVRGDSVFLNIPDVATFAIRDGAKIEVDRYPSSTASDVRLFLLGSAMGALLHQRGLMPLHASSVWVDGCGIAFSADSGGGKSTLAALFAQRGYQVSGDDVAVPEWTPTNELLLRAGAPRIRLAWDTVVALGRSSKLKLRNGDIDGKVEMAIGSREAGRPVPLSRIYFLEFDEAADSAPQIEPMDKYAAVVALRSNVYRPSLISSLGKEREFLGWASRALATVDCYRLRRTRDLSRLSEVGDVLEEHWSGISRARGAKSSALEMGGGLR